MKIRIGQLRRIINEERKIADGYPQTEYSFRNSLIQAAGRDGGMSSGIAEYFRGVDMTTLWANIEKERAAGVPWDEVVQTHVHDFIADTWGRADYAEHICDVLVRDMMHNTKRNTVRENMSAPEGRFSSGHACSGCRFDSIELDESTRYRHSV